MTTSNWGNLSLKTCHVCRVIFAEVLHSLLAFPFITFPSKVPSTSHTKSHTLNCGSGLVVEPHCPKLFLTTPPLIADIKVRC